MRMEEGFLSGARDCELTVSTRLACGATARVSGACFAMGEAAGTAAALALGGNTIPRDIAVDKLQHQLKQQGAFLGQDQAIPERALERIAPRGAGSLLPTTMLFEKSKP